MPIGRRVPVSVNIQRVALSLSGFARLVWRHTLFSSLAVESISYVHTEFDVLQRE